MFDFLFQLFIGYWTLSILLFLYPTLIRKKKVQRVKIVQEALEGRRDKCLLIAHRGGSREVLENTLGAFQHAINNGADIIETDLHITKDQIPIIFHDRNAIRLCGKNVEVRELNYNELPPFADKVPIHFTDGKCFEDEDNKNKKVLKLEEAFQKFPNTVFHIDLKYADDILVEEAYKLICKYNMQDKVIWGTSNHAKSLKVQQLDPEMNVFLTTKGWWITVITFFLGLLPFMNLHYDTFSCPKFTVESKQELLKTGLKTFGDKFAYFFLGSVDKVQKLIFLHLQRRGIACLPWVLNDPQDFAESIEHGANGIMTDSPMLLNEYLIKTGKKF